MPAEPEQDSSCCQPIALTGHVRTWAEHDAVVGAAWMASGVIDVQDELRVTG